MTILERMLAMFFAALLFVFFDFAFLLVPFFDLLVRVCLLVFFFAGLFFAGFFARVRFLAVLEDLRLFFLLALDLLDLATGGAGAWKDKKS
jgi:hypothetical protein